MQLFRMIINVVSILYPLLLALLCFHGSSKLLWPSGSSNPALQASRRFSPALLGVALLFFTLAEVAWFVNTVIMGQTIVYPSLQQYAFLGMYPFLICAFLLLPSPNLSLLSRLRILLDSLIIMVAITTLCYYFILAPILMAGVGTMRVKIVASIFPEADLVLLFCLLLVILRFGAAALRPVLILFGVSIFGLFITHVIHLSEVLSTRYNQFSQGDVILFLVGILIVGAAQTLRRMLDKGEIIEPIAPQKMETIYSTERWKTLLPSVMLLIFSLLVYWIWLTGGGKSFPGQIVIVYAGGFVVLLLVVVRQFLAVHEISVLQRELQIKNRSLSLLNEQLEQQATRDPLTGLPNHQALAKKLDEELARALHTQTLCSLLFIDIDYFKGINDKYGHQMGDSVLCQFGALVQATLRSTDYVGRWGGEEFVAVLSRTDSLEAFGVAERIRNRVARQVFVEHDDVRITCSLGVATYPEDATEHEGLIARADAAMYVAKHLGRNQTRIAHEPMVLAMDLTGWETSSVSEEREALGTVEALIALHEARDPATSQHERRVAALARKLAISLGLSKTDAHLVSLGGLLHDLGKMALPDELLLKRGCLTGDEFDRVCQHPMIGAEVLSVVPALREVAAIVRSHHERMDGSGYPDGLQGEAIPLGARIVAVADAYDVTTHTRSYHQARSSAEALGLLQKSTGSQFDPRVVTALVSLLASHPESLFGDVA